MAEELTDEQIGELRGDLQTLQRELRSFAGETADDARVVEVNDALGPQSRLDSIQQQQLVSEERRRYERRLRLVDAALVAIDSGEYGTCTRCEEPIGFARLKARPEGQICVRCQERAESAR